MLIEQNRVYSVQSKTRGPSILAANSYDLFMSSYEDDCPKSHKTAGCNSFKLSQPVGRMIGLLASCVTNDILLQGIVKTVLNRKKP